MGFLIDGGKRSYFNASVGRNTFITENAERFLQQ